MKLTERDKIRFRMDINKMSVLEKAYLISKLSSFAYLKFEEDTNELLMLKNNLATIDIPLVDIFNSGGIQAYFARRNDIGFLIFRGTEIDSLKDLLTNLDIRFYETIKGKKHSGYYEAFQGIKSNVLSTMSGIPTIYLGGHSLGGALAAVAADFIEGFAEVFTFGSPKHLNGKYSNKRLFRFVCAGDPIPEYPFNYKYVGELCYIKNKKVFSNIPLSDNIFNYIKNIFMKQKLFNKYNLIQNYCKRLEKIICIK